MKRSKTIDFVAQLDECGWFQGVPEKAAKPVRAAVSRTGKNLWKKLAVVDLDPECIYEEGDYTEILKEFAKASGGLFSPEDVREVWTDGKAEISFRLAGRDYRRKLPVIDDYIEGGFLTLIHKAMNESGGPVRFIPMRGLDMAFAFTTPAAFKKAESAGLIPSRRSEEAEHRRVDEAQATRFWDPRRLLFSRDGRILVLGCRSKVWVLEGESGRVAKTIQIKEDLYDAALIDGRRLAFSDSDALRELDLETGRGRPLGRVRPREHIGGVQASPDGRSVFAFVRRDDDGELFAADLDCRECASQGRLPPGNIRDMTFSPNGSVLALANGDQGIVLWEVRKRVVRATVPAGPWVEGLDWHPGGDRLAVCGREEIRVLSVPDGRELARCAYKYTGQSMPERVTFSPDGAVLATWGAADGGFTLWDPATGRKRLAARLHPDTSKVVGLAFAPSSRVVATAGMREDGEPGDEVVFYDLAARKVALRTSGGPAGR